MKLPDRRPLRLPMLAATLLLVLSALPAAIPNWEWLSPTPSGFRLNAYAFGQGTFVGVGDNGQIMTSPDGASWELRDGPAAGAHWQQVLFDGTRFVAHRSGTFGFSPDGIVWTKTATSLSLGDLAYGEGIYIGVTDPTADAAPLQYSTDATTWTDITVPPEFSAQKVLFADGVFLVLGDQGDALRSPDGITWSPVSVDANVTAPSPVMAAATADRFLVRWSNDRPFHHSADGAAWQLATQDPSTDSSTYASLGASDDTFFFDPANPTHQTFRSSDGDTWTPSTGPWSGDANTHAFNVDFNTLTVGNDTLIASGSGQPPLPVITDFSLPQTNQKATFVHTSDDGQSWSLASTETAFVPDPVKGISYGLGRYFSTGKTSLNGENWAETGFQPTWTAGDVLFRFTSTYNYGAPVDSVTGSPGYTNVYDASIDGFTATPIDLKLGFATSVAFSNGRYVFVGALGQISTSTDGFEWALTPSGTTQNLHAIVYAFGQFVALGDGPDILTSPDGLTWTVSAAPDYHGPISFGPIIAGSDRLVVKASRGYPANPSIDFTLPDGTPLRILRRDESALLTYFDGNFIALAADSYHNGTRFTTTLRTSPDATTWTSVAAWETPGGAGPSQALAAGPDSVLVAASAKQMNQTDYLHRAFLRAASSAGALPVITHHPVAVTVARGETARFGFGGTGAGPLTYQWYHDGVAIANASDSVLEIPLADAAAAGAYTVAMTNPHGTVTSSAATLQLTEATPLTFTRAPADTALTPNQFAYLRAEVAGSGPVSFQWRRNGVPLIEDSAFHELIDTPDANTSVLRVLANANNHPDITGSYDVVANAPHSSVTSEAASVAWGGPTLSLNPTGPVSAEAGTTFTAIATATGSAPLSYVWYRTDTDEIVSTNGPELTLSPLTEAHAGSYAVKVYDTDAHFVEAGFSLTVTAAPPTPPSPIVSSPESQSVGYGAQLSLTIETDSPADDYTYQWFRNGLALAGETAATLELDVAASTALGSYSVRVTADGVSYFSDPAEISLRDARLVNLSARAWAGTGDETITQGFVSAGDADATLLLRSIGPGLINFEVAQTIPDPHIEVLDANHDLIATNDDWHVAEPSLLGRGATAENFAAMGAFGLEAKSLDSALLLLNPPAGLFTTSIADVNGGAGIALTEIYAPTDSNQRLINLSTRALTGADDRVLTAGFVIEGTEPLRVLIRGVGPSLDAFGVANPLINPIIDLFNADGDRIGNNDTWIQSPQAAEINTIAELVGAFSLPEGSNDAALLVWLHPGLYTVQVRGVDEAVGIALVEIYVVP